MMIGTIPARTLPLHAPHGSPLRRLLAAALRTASRALARLARQVSATEKRRAQARADMVLEFYAEAGAPEGALYLDGQLIGYLPGVTRL